MFIQVVRRTKVRLVLSSKNSNVQGDKDQWDLPGTTFRLRGFSLGSSLSRITRRRWTDDIEEWTNLTDRALERKSCKHRKLENLGKTPQNRTKQNINVAESVSDWTDQPCCNFEHMCICMQRLAKMSQSRSWTQNRRSRSRENFGRSRSSSHLWLQIRNLGLISGVKPQCLVYIRATWWRQNANQRRP